MNVAEKRQKFRRDKWHVAGQDQRGFAVLAMRERRANSAERAQVFMQIEDQLRPVRSGEILIPLDPWIVRADDYSQTTGDGAGRGERPLDHRNAVYLQPGLVLIHPRTPSPSLN